MLFSATNNLHTVDTTNLGEFKELLTRRRRNSALSTAYALRYAARDCEKHRGLRVTKTYNSWIASN